MPRRHRVTTGTALQVAQARPCLPPLSAAIFCLLLPFAASSAFGQSNPVPFVNQPLVPSAVAPGGPSFTLTVNGTGFVSGATVNWNGTPLSTTFVSSSKLTATVPSGNIAAAGTASITVVNPTPGGGRSNVVFLPVALQTTTAFTDAPRSPITVGIQPDSVATADFNGDGKLDLAVTNQSSDDVTILLGNGDGTFSEAPGSPISVGPSPDAIAAGDFNGDGKMDLAVCNYSDNTVSIFLGNGDGTFAPATVPLLDVGAFPTYVAVGDFNGDGRLDLAVTSGGGGISIFLGNGDGTFSPAPGSPISVTFGAGAVAVGDFNGDGRLDLAVASEGVEILLGNGDGTFQPASFNNSPVNIRQFATGDFNGDGKLDLAAAADAGLYILLGNGDGTFSISGSIPVPTSRLALADFNGDAKLDLAINARLGVDVDILLGDGDGTFTPEAVPAASDGAPSWLAVGDFNQDGRLDIATANFAFNDVSILLQVPVPPVRLSSSSLDFPTTGIGTTSSSQTISLINEGTVSLNITSISATGDFAVQASGTTCSTSTPLPANSTCAISITFTPTATAARSGTLTVTDSAANSPQTANLSGAGIVLMPVLAISKTHTGDFFQGQVGATYTIFVTNIGTTQTSGTVTVTDSLPAGLTAMNMAGGVWTCTVATLTCTTGGTLNAGSSFLPIILTVNVAANAPASVTNSATVTGGGVVNPNPANTTATDPTTVLPPLALVSVVPNSGGGVTQTFQFTVFDAAGFDFRDLGMMFNTGLASAGTCLVIYSGGALFLASDAGARSYLPPLSVGSPGTLSNSQCAIDVGASSISTSVTGSSASLTVFLRVAFSSTYVGAKTIYMMMDTNKGQRVGWQAMGTWTIPSSPPVLVGVTPSSGSGTSQVFQFAVSDPNGTKNLRDVSMMFNTSLTSAHICLVEYYAPNNSLYLASDAGATSGYLGPVAVGSGGTLANSQCTVGGPGTAASGSGTNFTVTLPVTFSGAYTGAKNIYLVADNLEKQRAGWQAVGTWTIP